VPVRGGVEREFSGSPVTPTRLAVLAGLLIALVAFEVVRYADARAAVRAEEAHH
jgi:hypothetical protein